MALSCNTTLHDAVAKNGNFRMHIFWLRPFELNLKLVNSVSYILNTLQVPERNMIEHLQCAIRQEYAAILMLFMSTGEKASDVSTNKEMWMPHLETNKR